MSKPSCDFGNEQLRWNRQKPLMLALNLQSGRVSSGACGHKPNKFRSMFG
jgi:hypothetical protein